MENKIFKLFACCIPVKGVKRSIICDLQRNSYKFIPNILYDILRDNKEKTIKEIKSSYNNNYNKILDEYFVFLINHEFGFFCSKDNLESFPEINLHWDRPNLVTNFILDISENSTHDFKKIVKDLDILGCSAIQIRFFNSKNINDLNYVLSFFTKSRIRHIELLLPWNKMLKNNELEQLSFKHKRIFTIGIFSSPLASVTKFPNSNAFLINLITTIDDCGDCGQIQPHSFSINLDAYSEALSFNSCLNRKMSINEYGEIKNCPSMKISYGNIKTQSLTNVVNSNEFKTLWGVKKDDILICKDCEFRYICTDCRAYLEEPDNIFSKPLKCGYDPYTTKWES